MTTHDTTSTTGPRTQAPVEASSTSTVPSGGTAAGAAPGSSGPVPVAPPGGPNPVLKWWRDACGDIQARKARGDGRWWWMRWMTEQPTSVADHLDHYLGRRRHRLGGRAGWGLRTAIPLINDVHAVCYVVFGLTWGLVWTLVGYAVVWVQQRPGRAFLLVAALMLIKFNLSAWRAGS